MDGDGQMLHGQLNGPLRCGNGICHSKPGGVDLGAAGKLGLTVIWALSLPGKVAPVTAGAAIRDTPCRGR